MTTQQSKPANKGKKQGNDATEFEVLADMVANMDKIARVETKGSEKYKRQHELVVTKILSLNRQFGKGFTNISDVRSINSIMRAKGYKGIEITNSKK